MVVVVVSFVLPVAILGEGLWEFMVAGDGRRRKEEREETRQKKKFWLGGGGVG